MAAGLDSRPSAAALSHAAFDPLRPWLDPLLTPTGAWPDTDALNALAASAPRETLTGGGKPVRFVVPDSSDLSHYERRIFDSGRVDTRSENLHDLFNALVWLAFPRLKAALNARHVAELPREGERRSPLRDLLTLIDEGGVLVACAAESIAGFEALIRGFRWRELFWERRTALLRDLRFVLVGHAAYEKALAPYAGITCKALFLATPPELIRAPCAALAAWLDVQAADFVHALPPQATPRQFAPLPVFGYPGWLAGSSQAGFYADRRWFRPGRKLGQAA